MNKKKIIIIIGIIVLISIIGIVIFINNKNLKEENEKINNRVEEINEKESKKEREEEEEKSNEVIEVPDISALTREKAEKVLKEEGFESYQIVEISDSETPKNHVVKTIPAPGTKRTKDSVITIYISTGEEKIIIDNYVGKNYLEVKGDLEAKGISVIITRKESKDINTKQGEVIEQSVKPGTELKMGDTITITIPDLDETYPDFTDGSYTIKDIQLFCDDHGVTLVIKENGTCGKNKICKQSRPKGYTVRSNTILEITVGDGSTNDNEKQECDELSGDGC